MATRGCKGGRWKDRQRKGCSSWSSTPPLQRRPPSQESYPQRPGRPGLHLARPLRRISRRCLQQSPPFTSNKQPCTLPSHRFCNKSADISSNTSPTICSCVKHFPISGPQFLPLADGHVTTPSSQQSLEFCAKAWACTKQAPAEYT